MVLGLWSQGTEGKGMLVPDLLRESFSRVQLPLQTPNSPVIDQWSSDMPQHKHPTVPQHSIHVLEPNTSYPKRDKDLSKNGMYQSQFREKSDHTYRQLLQGGDDDGGDDGEQQDQRPIFYNYLNYDPEEFQNREFFVNGEDLPDSLPILNYQNLNGNNNNTDSENKNNTQDNSAADQQDQQIPRQEEQEAQVAGQFPPASWYQQLYVTQPRQSQPEVQQQVIDQQQNQRPYQQFYSFQQRSGQQQPEQNDSQEVQIAENDQKLQLVHYLQQLRQYLVG